MKRNFLYILFGEDDIRAEEFIQSVKGELTNEGISYESEIIDCSEVEIFSLLEKILTNPLFVNKKVLILKNFSSLLALESETDFILNPEIKSTLLPLLKSIAGKKESPVIIFIKLSYTKEAESFLKKEGLIKYVINLYQGKDWAIKKELREKAERDGYLIDEGALSLILEYAGDDYTQIYQEYEKAKLYTQNRQITRSLLEEIISPTKRFPIQELGRAFQHKDKKTALLALHSLFLYSGKLENIIGYFAGILFRLLTRSTRRDFAKGEEDYSLWERKEILARLKELTKIDKKIKTTSCDGETLLFKWVAEIWK
ncbi:MAG: DNA polymerase III subunit delta [candidate division WOR-3 bacterium]